MATVFFKKRGINVAGFVAFFIILSSCVYAFFLQNVTTVFHNKIFCFLVYPTTHVEAGAYETMQMGGAGYLLQTETRNYVAFSVYLNESDGESAKDNVKGESSVLQKTAGNLYFKTRKQKRNARAVINGLSCLYSCIDVLEKETRRLANGATQESSRRILESLQGQFKRLREEYGGAFLGFSKVCKKAQQDVETVLSGIIYVKDLRKISCFLCDAYVSLAGEYSL